VQTLKLRLTGTAPLLMHNGRLADPTNPIVKELKSSSKATGKGTTEGQERTSRLEFLGSLYLNETTGKLYLPGTAVERSLRDGSAGVERGLKKRFDAAVMVLDDPTLEYDKSGLTPDELFDAGYFLRVGAKVQMARIMRTRPKFDKWSATVVVSYAPSAVDKDTVLAAATYAGQMVGVGDWRPRYGRFDVKEIK
jgi:hypothetical protein